MRSPCSIRDLLYTEIEILDKEKIFVERKRDRVFRLTSFEKAIP